jgi:F0F1-type ATP synthase membrane subunit c/vacuolar-type H+-ATPase subunit K
MTTKAGLRIILLAAALLLGSGVLGTKAEAQCAMCKAAVSGLADGEALIRRLNFGIFILLVPPVGFFCGAFGLAYRYRNAPEDETTEE